MRDGMLHEAMQRLSIRELWARRQWTGSPGKSCHWPNSTDHKKAACSIFTATTGRHFGSELLKNHRTGLSYDGPGLLAEVEGLLLKDACRLFMNLAGVKPLDDTPAAGWGEKRKQPGPTKPAPPVKEDPPKPPPFDFTVLSPRDLEPDDMDAIATTRGVHRSAIEWLAKWGILHAVTITQDLKLPIPRQLRPLDAWCLHTPDFHSFRLRPYVGVFPGFDGQKYKSLTPSGAGCGVPVWCGPEDASRVLVVEAEGDAIAAADLARREKSLDGLAIMVMFSASIGIPSNFLPRLSARRVRIVPHCSDAKNQGQIAAVKWAASIRPFADDLHIFSLAGITMPTGASVGDLGDLALCPDSVLKTLEGVTLW